MNNSIHNHDLGFVKMVRNHGLLSVLKKRPSAFCLLALIALRAKRTSDADFEGLNVGEAFVGDYDAYGVTQQVYRTDKKWLEKWGLVTFRSTARGTVAKLVSKEFFDINAQEPTTDPTSIFPEEKHTSPTNTLTGDQRTTHEQATTNKNEEEKKERIKSRLKRFKSQSHAPAQSNDFSSTQEILARSQVFRNEERGSCQ